MDNIINPTIIYSRSGQPGATPGEGLQSTVLPLLAPGDTVGIKCTVKLSASRPPPRSRKAAWVRKPAILKNRNIETVRLNKSPRKRAGRTEAPGGSRYGTHLRAAAYNCAALVSVSLAPVIKLIVHYIYSRFVFVAARVEVANPENRTFPVGCPTAPPLAEIPCDCLCLRGSPSGMYLRFGIKADEYASRKAQAVSGKESVSHERHEKR